MKQVSFLIAFLAFSLCMCAQTMTVNSMKAMPMDLSASTNPRKDLNNKVCALVKVSLTIPNATFSGNPIGKVSRDGSDYWVYLPEGSKRMWVKHPNFKELEIDFAKYGIQRLQSKMTYKIDLDVPQLQQVAVVIPTEAKPAIEQAKKAKSKGKFDAIGMFFPLYGVTLGKTTHDDMVKTGLGVKFNRSDSYENFFINYINFWHKFDGGDAYNEITIDKDFIPKTWKEKFGFDGSLSFNQWKSLLSELGFEVEVICQPHIEEYEKRDVMAAKMIATAPDNKLRFTLDFNYGNANGEGTSPDSPNSLFEIICYAPGKGNIPERMLKASDAAAKKFKVSDAIKEFFPVYGITLGKSSFRDIINKGYIVHYSPNSVDADNIYAEINGWMGGKDIKPNDFLFTGFHSMDKNMPEKWVAKGFQFENSYNTWKKVLNDLGYAVVDQQQPVEAAPGSKDSFKGKIVALSPDATLRIILDFSHGTGKTRDAANTLSDIWFQVVR